MDDLIPADAIRSLINDLRRAAEAGLVRRNDDFAVFHNGVRYGIGQAADRLEGLLREHAPEDEPPERRDVPGWLERLMDDADNR